MYKTKLYYLIWEKAYPVIAPYKKMMQTIKDFYPMVIPVLDRETGHIETDDTHEIIAIRVSKAQAERLKIHRLP